MDAALRELSDQVDLATQRLLDDARTLNETELREPSLLPGWDRARVLAHLARGADLMRGLLSAARAGSDQPADVAAVVAATEDSAAQGAAELANDLAVSAMSLRAVIRGLPDEAWSADVRVAGLTPFPASQVLPRRLVEVELHHCDLGTGYGAGNWPGAFTTLELPEPMRSQRADRERYPAVERRAPARATGSWRPGQPLPGSWIGPARPRG